MIRIRLLIAMRGASLGAWAGKVKSEIKAAAGSTYRQPLLKSDAIALFLCSVAIGTVRLVFSVLTGVLVTYTLGSFLMALLAFALMSCGRTIISTAAAMIFIPRTHF